MHNSNHNFSVTRVNAHLFPGISLCGLHKKSYQDKLEIASIRLNSLGRQGYMYNLRMMWTIQPMSPPHSNNSPKSTNASLQRMMIAIKMPTPCYTPTAQELLATEYWIRNLRPQWAMGCFTHKRLVTFSFQKHWWLTNNQQQIRCA